ncbi:inositol polyphosphate kinase KCS1, partial [Ascoidea rubescens DSM 1968]
IYPLAVELKPFKDKVGGHTAIFRFSHRAICKALVNRENKWYEAVEMLHPELLHFMPKYIGVLNSSFSKINELTKRNSASLKLNENENIELPPQVVLDDNKHIIPDSIWKKFSFQSTSSPETDPNSIHSKDSTHSSLNSGTTNKFPGSNSSSNPKDSTILQCNNKLQNMILNSLTGSTSVNTELQELVIREVFAPIKKHAENVKEQMSINFEENKLESHNLRNNIQKHSYHLKQITKFEKFILLEDLTIGMKRPCVLDLKMGTRQYGIESNDKKQKSQRKKCYYTTSRKLGVRICGMQNWDKKNHRFIKRDKYFGRRIKKGEEFLRILIQFLYDGESQRSILKHIPKIVNKLNELKKIFSKLKGYRMYGSSLLLMYDGSNNNEPEYQDKEGDEKDEILVKIIDFSKCLTENENLIDTLKKYKCKPRFPFEVDKGYIRGINSLMFYFKLMFKKIVGEEYSDLSNEKMKMLMNQERFKKSLDFLDFFEEDTYEDEND